MKSAGRSYRLVRDRKRDRLARLWLATLAFTDARRKGREGMKKGLIVTVIALVALLLAQPVLAGSTVRAEADLDHQFNGSSIEAEAQFVDTGTSLTITAQAEGLNPSRTYFSLLYNAGSPVVGPGACEPTNNSINFVQMVVGVWTVRSDGTGTLKTTKSARGNTNLQDPANAAKLAPFVGGPGAVQAVANAPQYVALSQVGTISVRDVNAGFLLQACGAIETED